MSLAFDEELVRRMSDYLVARNRLRHAQDRGTFGDDQTLLRSLSGAEQQAEQACLDALLRRGWQPPYAGLLRGA